METTQTASSNEINKEELFSRLSEVDKKNLELLNQTFQSILGKEKQKARLMVVGGIISKPLPRKDIDIIAVFESAGNLPEQGSFKDFYAYSKADFENLRSLLEKVSKETNQFTVEGIIPPAIDEEFGSSAILKHDGTIKLGVKDGTPIEFIRKAKRNLTSVIAEEDKPFVLL